ncbi:MAG: Gfo/Idh/MocA family oxidoreductase [Bacteroidales bacterium]|nr:Gfo/Idh/MocA family oxidoreductase [Bacteroidales bacterium]
MKKRKINMGMVGGGPGSFIGKIHVKASRIDGQIELVCGAFDVDPANSKLQGEEYFLDPSRAYDNFQEMIAREKELPEGQRMDFLAVTTPNHVHFAPAKLALENGFHVVSDKPLTNNTEDARTLVKIVDDTGLIFALTHAYTGYPMVKEAREIVRSGKLGKIRKIVSEYPQGWLSTPMDSGDNMQADWRLDPARSGKSNCMGDIGTHALNLAEYITGLKVIQVNADISTLVEGRRLDDDGNVLVRFDNGARGIIYASQISAGEENGLKIRVYGEKGGLEWTQIHPNDLTIKWLDKPVELIRPGNPWCSDLAKYNTRFPAGHPEGLIEAFANIYRNVATCIQHRLEGTEPPVEALDYPTVYDGLRGMQFIDVVLESSQSDKKWTEFKK